MKKGLRIVVCGGPSCGKTHLSTGETLQLLFQDDTAPVRVCHTDDLLDGILKWGEDSSQVVTWMETPGPWVIEGVSGARALRKFIALHPGSQPCDIVYVSHVPKQELTKPGQRSMLKGCQTVWDQIEPELRRLGVKIVKF
jgi:hypothetical protein